MVRWIKQDIADYVASNIQDPLSRVNGVGDIDAYRSQYSMRISLDRRTSTVSR
ncbi:efflux RND transporter permease subunit [Escherichia coli]